MNTSEMTDIALPVEFLSYDSKTRRLLQVKTSGRDQISCSKEICKFGSDVEAYFAHDFCEIALFNGLSKLILCGGNNSLSLKSTGTPFLTSSEMLLRI